MPQSPAWPFLEKKLKELEQQSGTPVDAASRWAQVQKDAVTHQANCAAVASLPFLEKKLKELEQQSGTPVDAASK